MNIFKRLFGGIVRVQSLTINDDGTHTCTCGKHKTIVKDLTDCDKNE